MTDYFKNPHIITLKDVLKKREISLHLTLTSEQKQTLMQECALKDIALLRADFKIYPVLDNTALAVELGIISDVTHECVVTLDPVGQHILEKVFLRFVKTLGSPNMDIKNADIYLQSDIQTYDDEIMVDEQIDIFDIMREHFILALDILPRKSDAEFKGYIKGHLSPDEQAIIDKNIERMAQGLPPTSTENPFNALAELKKRL